MASKVAAHYISEKVAKVRWLPEKLLQSERFVTGSWDMDKNFVRMWRLYSNPYAENVEHTPRCNDKVSMEGDVTGLEFVNDDTLAVACADGKSHNSYFRKQHKDFHIFRRSHKLVKCTASCRRGSD